MNTSTITKEVLTFFQLNKMPFEKSIELENLLDHKPFEKSYQKLQLLQETRGIGVLTGRPGTGKSSVIRKWIKDMHPSLFKPVYICHTSVGSQEFYSHICAGLGLQVQGRKAKMFRIVKEHMEQMNYSNRIHPVLIIDEAHMLGIDVLKEIRLLTNFKVDSYNGLTVLLCGQEELNAKFNLTILESLASSITLSIKMDALSQEETFGYIEHRINCLRIVKEPLFTSNALKLLYEASGGNMRSINTIAKGALFKAFHTKSQQIEKEHVAAVI